MRVEGNSIIFCSNFTHLKYHSAGSCPGNLVGVDKSSIVGSDRGIVAEERSNSSSGGRKVKVQGLYRAPSGYVVNLFRLLADRS